MDSWLDSLGLEPGRILNGKYQLLSRIGQGGMGEVWRAKRLDLDAEVAIKMMHGGSAERTGALVRFNREARAAAGLRSPHVVQILDYGVDAETGAPFITMELLEGESLRERLRSKHHLPPRDVAELVVQVARALTRAHAAHIVHRDLKPENIFLVRNEDQELVKILDFGVAKASLSEGDQLATATGVIIGTPHYMSPEQMDSARRVDFRTDLWSLAVIACECMTGSRPFSATTLAELAMKIALGRAAKPSSLGPVPLGFDEWFARAIDVDPERRFQSAVLLANGLRAVTGEKQTVSSGAAPVDSLGATLESDSLDGLSDGLAAVQAAEPRAPAALPAAAPSTRPARRLRKRLLVAWALAAFSLAAVIYVRLSGEPVPPGVSAAGVVQGDALQVPAVHSTPLDPPPSVPVLALEVAEESAVAAAEAPAAPASTAPKLEPVQRAERKAERKRAGATKPAATAKAAAAKPPPKVTAVPNAAPKVDAFDMQ